MSTTGFHVVHFSTVHPPNDTRILSKECISLAKAGFAVTLVVPGDGGTSAVEGVVRRTLRIPRNRFLRMTIGQLRMAMTLLRLRADIFHFHDPELLPTALLLRVAGNRVVFDSHEHISKGFSEKPWLPPGGRRLARVFGLAIERLADRFMSGVVVTTAGMRESYPRGRTVLVRNVPRLDEFTFVPDWRERRSVACYLGLVTEYRGSRQLARLATRTSARIVLAGPLSDDDRTKLREESGWPLVDYRGVLDRRQVASLLSEAKIGLAILLPMKNFEDSIPTKLLEYLAAGLPVVASDFESWRTLTRGIDSVAFVNPLDEDALADAVNAILADPERAQGMGMRGREFVLNNFSWDREFQELLGLYSLLLENAHGPQYEKMTQPDNSP